MIFASTVPVLYPGAAVIFYLTFLSDKYLLLNFHTKPRNINEELHCTTYSWGVKAAYISYIAQSIWAFHVFNKEFRPFYGMKTANYAKLEGVTDVKDLEKLSKKNVLDNFPELVHVCVLAGVLLIRMIL